MRPDPTLAEGTLTPSDRLSKYPTLVNLEKQSQVPKAYAVLGLLATFATLIFFNVRRRQRWFRTL